MSENPGWTSDLAQKWLQKHVGLAAAISCAQSGMIDIGGPDGEHVYLRVGGVPPSPIDTLKAAYVASVIELDEFEAGVSIILGVR